MTEQEILKFWEENKIFEKSLEKESPKGDFVFYDGPPFATGTPHYGHLVGSAIKDAVPRYWTMRGYRVKRQWGWDCHGLPIENIVEKELGAKRKKDIEELGVKKFNALCREKIFTFVDVWNKFIPRFGRWADMKNPYRTMDKSFMESEWWAFKTLYEKGLVYEDYRSMHICPRCETTLAQSEVAEGYAEIKDISVMVKFSAEGGPASGWKDVEEGDSEPKTYILAWTTTPWTLPGNVALAVNPDIEYVKVAPSVGESGGQTRERKELFILAKSRLENIPGFKDGGYEIVEEFKGEDLIGKKYKPLFDYYSKDGRLKNGENGWKIYGADFVTTEDGTGVVHIAPAFGEDDMELGKKYNLPFVQHVGMDGRFKSEVSDFAGLPVKPRENPQAADIEIIKFLAKENKLFAKEKITHSYPHCWRCETPLLNYATSSWFVAVEKIKGDLLEYAKDINWSPAHIKKGRWLNWLENARDWSISRQRFWANTIPVWRCGECGKERVFGSASELEEASGDRVEDLHRDIVDDIAVDCECGAKARRVPDVLDTWFDSGSVPFASLHYPFENKEEFEARLPADFIAEGQDQVSKWFYYQHALSGALFGKNAFKNVVVNGIILAEDGKKMSKRLKNYPDPMDIIEKYGADALRYYLLSSPAVRAESLSFSEKGVDEVNKKVISKIRNVLSFYKMYKSGGEPSSSPRASIYNFPEDSTASPRVDEEGSPLDWNRRNRSVLDKWILSRLNETILSVTEAMDAYEPDRAVRPIGEFVDDLSNWYIRRSRDRFKSEGEDKKDAVAVTGYVLLELSKLIAPFTPFVAEEVYQEVAGSQPSVARQESVHLDDWPEISHQPSAISHQLLEDMKEVRKTVTLGLEERAKAGIKVRQPLASLKIKNQKSKIGNKNDLLDLIKGEVNVKEIVFDAGIKNDIELDTAITEELKREGMARELTRAVQDLRKKAGMSPGQKMKLIIETDSEGESFVNDFMDEIKKSTNSAAVKLSQAPNGTEIEIGNLVFRVEISE